jgi:cytochrome c oxidase subunit II
MTRPHVTRQAVTRHRSRWRPAIASGALALVASGCANAPSTVDARGPAAATIALLWWVMLILGTALFLIASAYLLYAAFRPVPARGPRALVGADNRFVGVWGIAIPAVVLAAVYGMTVWAGAETYWPVEEPELTIEVTGHQFWWEVRYPDGEVITANEIHMPTDQPVRIVLESGDVIHSFWVPQLHGKMDQIPGHTNEFWLQADEPGEYRGICAEYCGIQHARMHFLVIALEPDEFEDWLTERTREPEVAEAEVADGEQVFIEANCISCHAVRGLREPTAAGPDLTDFASRRTIAAGMRENTRDNLREWIIDPHATKPGARMPATPLPDAELEALLDYLESLR